jgi:hypothetical protein
MPFNVVCQYCGINFSVGARSIAATRKFCSLKCRGLAQKEDKPVTKDWLYNKYIVEKLDCAQIGVIVGRDPKSIWTWLKNFGIPTRLRGFASADNHFRKGQKTRLGKKHTNEVKEKIRQARLKDGHVPYLTKDGQVWAKGKKGPLSPVWKGGCTPERQAFYNTDEWKSISISIRKRDNFQCQRCGLSMTEGRKSNPRVKFAIHHIVSFTVKELRAEPTNLILLCRPCHLFVHSRENINKEFIKEYVK